MELAPEGSAILWRKLAVVGLVGLLSCPALAQRPTMVEGEESSVYLGPYEPREPRSLDELPPAVRGKLLDHLKNRLGEAYLSRLSFAGGQIVDVDELYKVNPGARDYQWKIFAYRLGFRLTAADKGIKAYNGYIELDRDGGVQKEIEFPAVRRFPKKANLVSLEAACRRAEAKGLKPQKAGLYYSKDRGSLVFQLTQKVADDGLTMRFRSVEIDAHSGEILKDYPHEGIR